MTKDKLVTLLIYIGFALTFSVLLFPTFTDSLNNIKQTTAILSYEDGVSGIDKRIVDIVRDNAFKYNRAIRKEQKNAAFSYRGENETDEIYEKMLSINGSTIMCFLEIPEINIYLPVVHGTRSDDLKTEVGHMYGTSVPSGGRGTHAVLAAHTGLQTVDLFTDLVNLKKGSEFYIHVLDEIHVYKVDEINVVLPDEEDPYLQVEEDEDYVTLYTCTPYGINDHRLLVRGKRSYPDIPVTSNEDEGGLTSLKSRKALARTVAVGAVPVLIILTGFIRAFRKKDQKTRKEEETEICAQLILEGPESQQ